MSRLPKRFTSLELKQRRQAKRARNRKLAVRLAAISADRQSTQIARERFPVTRKTNKRGANVFYPAYAPKHYIGLRGMTGHRISFTQTKAQWVENFV